MPNEVQTARYQALVDDIGELFESTRKTMAEAYWKIGQRIVQVDQDGELRAAYGGRLLERLSDDLARRYGQGFSIKNLERMRQFYLTHPKSSAPTELSWSHYVELFAVHDEKTRKRLEKIAAKEDLSSRQLRRLIKEDGAGGLLPESGPLNRPADLTLNTYRDASLIGVQVPEGTVVLDLGFCVQIAVAEESLKSVRLMARPSYAYSAFVERVVDGDTILVEVNLGFGVVVRERLRLRGVDAPELNTDKGKESRDFVAGTLVRGTPVVIRSYRTDIYGRFVADVFYLPQGGGVPQAIVKAGTFLNQELLDKGFAVRVK